MIDARSTSDLFVELRIFYFSLMIGVWPALISGRVPLCLDFTFHTRFRSGLYSQMGFDEPTGLFSKRRFCFDVSVDPRSASSLGLLFVLIGTSYLSR